MKIEIFRFISKNFTHCHLYKGVLTTLGRDSCLLPVVKGPCFASVPKYAFIKVLSLTKTRRRILYCLRVGSWVRCLFKRRKTGVNCSLTVAVKATRIISQQLKSVITLAAETCPVPVRFLIIHVPCAYKSILGFINHQLQNAVKWIVQFRITGSLNAAADPSTKANRVARSNSFAVRDFLLISELPVTFQVENFDIWTAEEESAEGVCLYRNVFYGIGDEITQLNEDDACKTGCKCVQSDKQ